MREWDKTKTGKEYHREYMREWQRENPESVKKIKERYYRKNKERILERIAQRDKKAEEIFWQAHKLKLKKVGQKLTK